MGGGWWFFGDNVSHPTFCCVGVGVVVEVGLGCDNSGLSSTGIKRKFKYAEAPGDQSWRIPICQELLELRRGSLDLHGFTPEERDEILDFVCIS